MRTAFHRKNAGVAFVIILLASSAQAQDAAWWEPLAPVYGQQFTVYYDDVVGTLPDGSSQCWLHWGVVDPQTGNWSAPPQSSWPAGSQLSSDGFACQSPMQRGPDTYWQVTIHPDESITLIEFVLTDMANNWDNNNNQNWSIAFVSGDIASWWYPGDPLPGDLITIYYNTDAGTLPAGAQNVKLHWGINEIGFGNWMEPPPVMWPQGTVPWGDGRAVQSPMTNLEAGIWAVEIQTNDTTYTLHYVVTDGSNWDNNGDQNWNVYLEEPPPVVSTYHAFSYDTRSAFATYGIDDINSIAVAGTFNTWSTTANPLSGPDEPGVYSTEVNLDAAWTTYKFVVNGDVWLQDPDNPVTDGSSYMNSAIWLQPDSLPYFTQISPLEGAIVDSGSGLEVEAKVRASDYGPGISGEPTFQINGMPIPVSYDPETQIVTASTQVHLVGINVLTFTAQDSAGNVGLWNQNIGVFPSGGGFHAVDAEGDDVGSGNYSYPSEPDGAADILSLQLTESAGGDSIEFNIQLAEITDYTRVLVQICTQIEGFYFDAPLFDTETATPDWNGSGVQFCLADPGSPWFDPGVHNLMITQRDPVASGAALTLDPSGLTSNSFRFSLAVSDLEDVLGSYNRGWYFGAYSFLDGFSTTSGHCWEVDAQNGGLDATYDPDVFDALFMDSQELQKTIFSNFSGNRRCTLDNAGRGFALIEPAQIGPNVGSSGPALNILTRGALTIAPAQTITGVIETVSPTSVTIFHTVGLNQYSYLIPDVIDTFVVDLNLEQGVNVIWAEATVGGETGISPSIIFDLYVEQAPDAEIITSYESGIVTLDASGSSDPQGQEIDFLWSADPDNPEPINLTNPNSSVCTFAAPDTPGEYYADLLLTDPDENVSKSRTLATVYPDSVHPFEWNESVQWVQDALVYEIYPRSYSPTHQLSAITADMQRIYDMGYNTIWLMPIYPGPSDHGYEVTDYYGIEEDYGIPEDFAELVEVAHSYDVKVILDLVINHTSIQHPFMQDAMAFGPFSHYYNYYDRDANGNYTYYYDWISLPNLNYDNPEVWWEFINVSKYWVEQYGIDGYRCDVAWGPQSRNPDFWIAWRDALKTVKPEIFLLAEASSTDFTYFDYRFDSAMDWNLHHEGEVNFQNMFPGPPDLDALHEVIVNYGYPYPAYHYPLRFMENHDEARYVTIATPEETKLAAALLYSIPGIPQIYAGQEIGTSSQRGQIYWGSDPYDLADYYYKLGQIRRMLPALRTPDLVRLQNTQSSTVYSIGRYAAGENPVVSVLNFASWSQVVSVSVPTDDWGIIPDSTYYLNELLGNSYVAMTGAQLATITTSIDAEKARIYAISDSIILVGVRPDGEEQSVPGEYHLAQNYPNPFNQECRIRFEVPKAGKVTIAVYNIMGQKVRTLVSNFMGAGRYTISWDGRNDHGRLLSSGIYLYRLSAGEFEQTRKMILLK